MSKVFYSLSKTMEMVLTESHMTRLLNLAALARLEKNMKSLRTAVRLDNLNLPLIAVRREVAIRQMLSRPASR